MTYHESRAVEGRELGFERAGQLAAQASGDVSLSVPNPRRVVHVRERCPTHRMPPLTSQSAVKVGQSLARLRHLDLAYIPISLEGAQVALMIRAHDPR